MMTLDKRAENYVSEEMPGFASDADKWLAGYAACAADAAKVARAQAIVEENADDTMQGIRRGEPYRKLAAAIETLATTPAPEPPIPNLNPLEQLGHLNKQIEALLKPQPPTSPGT